MVIGTTLAALTATSVALPSAGNYSFAGGTPAQQSEVRAALEASTFDWSVVPGRITIHLGRGTGSSVKRGEIWIDAALLRQGIGAWGPIQYLYAREVDLLLLDASARATFAPLLHARVWCGSDRARDHRSYGCERFASTLVWAYWPSQDNSFSPRSPKDPSAAMPPERFRATLSALLAKRR